MQALSLCFVSLYLSSSSDDFFLSLSFTESYVCSVFV